MKVIWNVVKKIRCRLSFHKPLGHGRTHCAWCGKTTYLSRYD